MRMSTTTQKRILIVDDNKAIHEDFYKVLVRNESDRTLDDDEKIIFNEARVETINDLELETPYLIDSAYQGEEALELVRQSLVNEQPYALAFIDVLMPPGWNGLETIQQIWAVDPEIQVVICSAYSEYSWKRMVEEIGITDNFLVLKKPFEVIEIRQLASALTKKWELKKQVQSQIDNLEKLVSDKTYELERSLSLTKATLESIEEGVVVINKYHKIGRYNQKFLDMWKISQNSIESEDINSIFQYMSHDTEDSDLFLKTIMDPSQQSNKDNHLWKLKSKRVLELYKHPQILNDKIVGTVLSFRDVTDRKTIEDQVLSLLRDLKF